MLGKTTKYATGSNGAANTAGQERGRLKRGGLSLAKHEGAAFNRKLLLRSGRFDDNIAGGLVSF
jgi:hypothetical protein